MSWGPVFLPGLPLAAFLLWLCWYVIRQEDRDH